MPCADWTDNDLVFPPTKEQAEAWRAMGGRYGQAVAKWWDAGRPLRTLAEANRIITDHCDKC